MYIWHLRGKGQQAVLFILTNSKNFQLRNTLLHSVVFIYQFQQICLTVILFEHIIKVVMFGLTVHLSRGCNCKAAFNLISLLSLPELQAQRCRPKYKQEKLANRSCRAHLLPASCGIFGPMIMLHPAVQLGSHTQWLTAAHCCCRRCHPSLEKGSFCSVPETLDILNPA